MESPYKSAARPVLAKDAPFAAGAIVVVTLHSPREKFWGAVLELSPAGLACCGVDLNSFDDFASLVKRGEAQPCVVFFPMHRIERVELDTANGAIPAIADRFAQKSGRSAASVLAASEGPRS